MTFLPPDAGVTSSLVEIISNPSRAKAYLEDIAKKTIALNQAGEVARNERIAADIALAKIEKTLKGLEDFHANHDTDYAAKDAKLKDREAKAALTEANAKSERKALSVEAEVFKKLCDDANKALQAREAHIAIQEKHLIAQEQAVTQLRETYENKIAVLKAALV